MQFLKYSLSLILVFSFSYLFGQKVKISLASKLTEINESCAILTNDKIQISLDSTAKVTTTLLITKTGTASRGSDYATTLGDTVIFLRGDSTKSFDLTVFNDGAEEVPETILLISTHPNGTKDTFRILINDQIFRINTTQDSFTMCSNEPFELPLTVVNRAQLTWSPVDMMRRDAKGKYFVNPIRTGKIVITGTLDNCTQKDSIFVTSLPIGVNLNTRDTVFLCFPDSVRLNATVNPANAQISWTLDNQSRLLNNTSIMVRPRESRNYIVNVSSGICKASDTTHVRIDSLRNTRIVHFPVKKQYCQGDSIFFFSTGHPKNLFPFIKPNWNPSTGFQTPADTLNAVVLAQETTTYLRITQNNACRQIDSLFIKVVEPSVSVGPVDTTVCPGTTVQINFKADGSEYKDFKWTPQDGLISCEKCPDPKIKVNGQQMYKVEAKKDGCNASTELSMNVFTKPTSVRIGIDVPAPIIAGSNIRISLLGTENMRARAWRVDGTIAPINPAIFPINAIKAGRHTVDVEVTDQNGCMWTYSFPFDVICPPNTIQLQRAPIGTIYEGTTITITAVGVNANATNIRWSRNGNTISGSGFAIQDKPAQAGTYTYRFEAFDPNGCPIAQTINVTVVACISAAALREKIPNAFSPNGDQKNDFFFYSDGGLQITKLLVFSRWGQLVYNNTNPEQGWDGKIAGQPAAADVYIYRMTYICGDGAPQEVSGTVTLLR